MNRAGASEMVGERDSLIHGAGEARTPLTRAARATQHSPTQVGSCENGNGAISSAAGAGAQWSVEGIPGLLAVFSKSRRIRYCMPSNPCPNTPTAAQARLRPADPYHVGIDYGTFAGPSTGIDTWLRRIFNPATSNITQYNVHFTYSNYWTAVQ